MAQSNNDSFSSISVMTKQVRDLMGTDAQIPGTISANLLNRTTIADDQNMTVSLTGATDSSLILSSTGTGVDALQLTASAGGIQIVGGITSNYMKLTNLDLNGLTETAKTSAETDTGFPLVADTVIISAWNGDNAAAITLPTAAVDSFCAFEFSAQADGGANITFTCATGNTFAVETLLIPTENMADKHLNPYHFSQVNAPASTGDATLLVGAAGNNTLTIAATGINNITNVGAMLVFYSDDGTTWRFGFRGSQLGTGAINATFALTTV